MLPCGHHEACMYRYLDRGLRKKYCLACIVEKFGDCEIFSDLYNKKWLKQEKLEPEKIETAEKVDIDLKKVSTKEQATGPINKRKPKIKK